MEVDIGRENPSILSTPAYREIKHQADTDMSNSISKKQYYMTGNEGLRC